MRSKMSCQSSSNHTSLRSAKKPCAAFSQISSLIREDLRQRRAMGRANGGQETWMLPGLSTDHVGELHGLSSYLRT